MDLTVVATELLEPIPANRLFGIRVLSAGPEGGEVTMSVAPEATNVIGSLHSSGLGALTVGDRRALRPFWVGGADRADLVTPVVVHDAQGTLVCDGSFTWRLRRQSRLKHP